MPFAPSLAVVRGRAIPGALTLISGARTSQCALKDIVRAAQRIHCRQHAAAQALAWAARPVVSVPLLEQEIDDEHLARPGGGYQE
jgi:hypothetical protein